MEPTFTTSTNEETCIIYHELRGKLYMDDILHNLQSNFTTKTYNDDFSVLVDIRQAEFPDFIHRIKYLLDFFNSWSKKKNMKRKCAILAGNQIEVANAILFKFNLAKIKTGLVVDVFTSRNEALDWLKLS